MIRIWHSSRIYKIYKLSDDINTNKCFCKELKKYREQKGLSTQEFAELSKVNYLLLSKLLILLSLPVK